MNTGSTDLRDTEVQQPNTTATLSLEISSRAFSANSGQFEAGSTTTGSSFLPSRPPLAFCSLISISITSFSVVSLMAMVPESECRMPTLMVSAAWAALIEPAAANAKPAAADSHRRAFGRDATAFFDLIMSEIPCNWTRANVPTTFARKGVRKPCAKASERRKTLFCIIFLAYARQVPSFQSGRM